MNSLKNLLGYIVLTLVCFYMMSELTPLSAQILERDLIKNFKYRAIGPTRQGGRYVDYAVVESKPQIYYAATASGGLWKTTNNGITFEPVFDYENVFSIGAVAVSQSNPDIVWVGTGESNNSRSQYWGDGVYKSTDAGKTWKNMGLKESHHIGRIVIHPDDPDIVYIAASGHLYSENPERGVYKTTNGGYTWEKSLDVIVRGKHIGAIDIAMNPENNNILYAALYDKVRKPWTFNLGGPGSGIYKTTDAGKTWKKLEGGLPGGMLGRIGIDIYDKNPNIVYAVIENANKPGMSDKEREQELLLGKSSRGIIGDEIYRTEDGGNTWVKTHHDTLSLPGGPPYYYAQIRVDPNNYKHIYRLTSGMIESWDGGKTFKRPFRFGGDNHAMWINPDNSDHMLLGYDHGMGVTYDGGKNWYHPDTIPLAQLYAIGVDMDYPYNVYGGTQDNGSLKGPSNKRDGGPIMFEDWKRVGGGDGFYNVVDYTDSRWLYNESQFGYISRRNQRTGEVVSIRPEDPELRFNWCSPIEMSPHNPKVIFFGANKLMRSDCMGDVWEAISPDLTNPDSAKLTTGKGGDGNIQYSTITTIDESSIIPGLIWVGTDDGNVQLTKDGGKTWTKLNNRITGNPGYWISRVIASQHYPGTAYVSYTGYRRDDFRAFLYKTTDYGETWTSIVNNLPDESINVIREDHKNPNLLFVGTDLAVYVSINGGKTWRQFKLNMPTQPVHDLVIHPRENDLVVGTHGRGFFITDISPLQELTKKVLEKEVYLFDIEPKVKWIDPGNNVYSYQNYEGKSEPVAVAINYYLKNDMEDNITIMVFKGNRKINELETKNKRGIHCCLWDMTVKRERSEEEIEKIKEQQKDWPEYRQLSGDRLKYETTLAMPGEYTVELSVNGKVFRKKAVILQDYWFDK